MTIEITGGVKVVCPGDWRMMTPFVLIEQQDWFEDEIRFLRTLIEPGSQVVDIGANYGLYSLAAAKLATRGHVWSYEPCGATTDCLRRSIAENGFDNVTLMQMALSDNAGFGMLQIGASPELNALVDVAVSGAGAAETVELTTLDAQRRAHRWDRIDFVKIDAEGHEARIVDGGLEFFMSESPLVMCEVKAGVSVDMRAADRLIGLGYRPYRLVPGLQALAPQDLAEALDAYQLNLFLCKADRAEALHRRGLLVIESGDTTRAQGVAVDDWQVFLAARPWGKVAIEAWTTNVAEHPVDGWDDYRDALNLYARSRDPRLDIAARFDALQACYRIINGFIAQKTTAPRLMSYARVSADLGARAQAVNALSYVVQNSGRFGPWDFLREPLLSPSAEFDTIAPSGHLREWAHAAALDAFERLRSFSGYFSDPGITLGITRALAGLGYLTPQMKTRAELAQRRVDGNPR
jgi:FkbM family methyltransferase